MAFDSEYQIWQDGIVYYQIDPSYDRKLNSYYRFSW